MCIFLQSLNNNFDYYTEHDSVGYPCSSSDPPPVNVVVFATVIPSGAGISYLLVGYKQLQSL